MDNRNEIANCKMQIENSELIVPAFFPAICNLQFSIFFLSLYRPVFLSLCLILLVPSGPQNKTDSSEAGKLRDITGIEHVPPPAPKSVWVFLVAGAGLVLMGLFLAGWKFGWLRSRSETEIAPDQWALAEIERIEKTYLQNQNPGSLNNPGFCLVEQYFTELSDVVRRYLESRFGSRASRQTTPEFLESIRDSAILRPEQQASLREFLQQADLAKFSRAAYSADECRSAAQAVRQFIGQTTIQALPPGGLGKVQATFLPK